MAGQSTPYIRDATQLLNELRQINSGIREQLGGQLEQLQKGFEHLATSMHDHTDALGEMQIFSLIGELAALKQLIDEEGRLLETDLQQDEMSLKELKGHFQRAVDRLSEVRNKRVEKLLGPVLELLDTDHDRHIEARAESLGQVFEDFLDVTASAVRDREVALKSLLQQTHDDIVSFIEQREAVQGTIQEKQIELSGGDGELGIEAYGIPFYVVEIADQGGSTRAMVVPPSRMKKEFEQPTGYDLEPIEEFGGILRALQDKAAFIDLALAKSSEGRGARERIGLRIDHPGTRYMGIVERFAHNSMCRYTKRRSIEVVENDSEALRLRRLLSHHAGYWEQRPEVS